MEDRSHACSNTAASSAATSESPANRCVARGQQRPWRREEALLVVGVTAGSPAAAAGVLVGDVILELDGHAIGSPEDLLDLLLGDRVGRRR